MKRRKRQAASTAGPSGVSMLTNLPPAFLASMVLASKDQPTMRALSSTCKELHKLVHNQPALVFSIALVYDYAGACFQEQPQLLKALPLADAAGLELHAELTAGQYYLNKPFNYMDNWFSLLRCIFKQPWQCITSVSLAPMGPPDDYVTIDSLIPTYLAVGCPNLQQLHLKNIRFNPDYDIPHNGKQPQLPPTSTTLHTLSLTNFETSGRGKKPGWSLKEQLLNLPSLTTLNVKLQDMPLTEEPGDLFGAAYDKYSHQLRHLSLIPTTEDARLHSGLFWPTDNRLRMPKLPWSPDSQFPLLTHLYLDSDLSDDGTQQLLQAAPNLISLKLRSIGEGKDTSFAEVPCSWQELTLDDVYVGDLALLPLSSCKRIVCSQTLDMQTVLHPEQAVAGAAAVEAAGGLWFSGSITTIKVKAGAEAVITAAAPLLQHLPDSVAVAVVCSDDVHPHKITADAGEVPWQLQVQRVLTALADHIKCKRVAVGPTLGMKWQDAPGLFARLPELLPHAQGFIVECTVDQFRSPPATTELVTMVETATRPFTLYFDHHSPDVQQQLEAAQQRAGNQLVTWEVWQALAAPVYAAPTDNPYEDLCY